MIPEEQYSTNNIQNRSLDSNLNEETDITTKKFGRKNRGTRVKMLSEEEVKHDDEIYNQIFGGDSGEEEYNGEESAEEKDSFDSDFFNEEEENEEEDDSFDEDREARKRKIQENKRKMEKELVRKKQEIRNRNMQMRENKQGRERLRLKLKPGAEEKRETKEGEEEDDEEDSSNHRYVNGDNKNYLENGTKENFVINIDGLTLDKGSNGNNRAYNINSQSEVTQQSNKPNIQTDHYSISKINDTNNTIGNSYKQSNEFSQKYIKPFISSDYNSVFVPKNLLPDLYYLFEIDQANSNMNSIILEKKPLANNSSAYIGKNLRAKHKVNYNENISKPMPNRLNEHKEEKPKRKEDPIVDKATKQQKKYRPRNEKSAIFFLSDNLIVFHKKLLVQYLTDEEFKKDYLKIETKIKLHLCNSNNRTNGKPIEILDLNDDKSFGENIVRSRKDTKVGDKRKKKRRKKGSESESEEESSSNDEGYYDTGFYEEMGLNQSSEGKTLGRKRINEEDTEEANQHVQSHLNSYPKNSLRSRPQRSLKVKDHNNNGTLESNTHLINLEPEDKSNIHNINLNQPSSFTAKKRSKVMKERYTDYISSQTNKRKYNTKTSLRKNSYQKRRLNGGKKEIDDDSSSSYYKQNAEFKDLDLKENNEEVQAESRNNNKPILKKANLKRAEKKVSFVEVANEEEDKDQNLGFQYQKYNYHNQPLPSQKELLYEAIFTEIFNNQSLEELRRIEDLQKREMPNIIKKKFQDHVKVSVEKEGSSKVSFSNPNTYGKIFNSFQTNKSYKEKTNVCAVTGQKAKYFDPLTGQHYFNVEAFKIIREKYFQKEEDSLLFRIQTLSDLASQKKEKLRKLLLSNPTGNQGANNKNIMDIMNKIGIMKSEPIELEKKTVSTRVYSRSRENCVNSGMLLQLNPIGFSVSRKIFKDKHSFSSKLDPSTQTSTAQNNSIKASDTTDSVNERVKTIEPEDKKIDLLEGDEGANLNLETTPNTNSEEEHAIIKDAPQEGDKCQF